MRVVFAVVRMESVMVVLVVEIRVVVARIVKIPSADTTIVWCAGSGEQPIVLRNRRK